MQQPEASTSTSNVPTVATEATDTPASDSEKQVQDMVYMCHGSWVTTTFPTLVA